METYFGKHNWKWVGLHQMELENINPPLPQDPASDAWLKHARKNQTNYVKISSLENGEKVLNGSLIFQQSFRDEWDFKIFHFYLKKDLLVTVGLELPGDEQEEIQQQLGSAENAVDGCLFFLGEIVNGLLVEIDKFEVALKTLIWGVRKRNETKILELLYARRHELLVAKNLLIPIKELRMAIEEINLHGSSEVYASTCRRIERAMALLGEYEHELDAMINLEEVISSHRGNEIMKTLTVMTTIFTPVMAFGALWGMNFKHMPELEWRFGYILSLVLIVVSTALLYGYLKMKGWTGDLLKGKKRGSFFK
ncbi:magnesium transporter CorA family protein [Neobacillus rhizophilus]|uniref:Magnesium transporter CorA family protein n=1 Tax=Neobacillus rhizophilus TaxID=2833579 RepID=A0A942U3N1_9BACI|nr:magnesium transporter CorA family protein [Neobacillus rhizophilus]MBS4212630.1 magnesium transporter CorA family protein [Neobacillus rhizophilus]